MVARKRVFSFFMAAVLVFSCFSNCISVSASEFDVETSSNKSTREVLILQYSKVITHGNGYQVRITIPYQCATDTSNVSNYKITAILTGSTAKVSGWYAVRGDLQYNSITYYDNNQIAVISYTYYASIGAGYTAYTGTATIDIR